MRKVRAPRRDGSAATLRAGRSFERDLAEVRDARHLRAVLATLRIRAGSWRESTIASGSTGYLACASRNIIRDRVVYRDLGADHFTKRDPAKAAKRLLKRLAGLGYAVDAR